MQLVLGTAQLRRTYGAVQRRSNELTTADAIELLLHGQHIGIDAIDTAPVYGDAEATIGAAGVVLPVHTKIDPTLPPTVSVERSLQQLRRSTIDVLYIHDPAEILNPRSRVIAEAHELVGSLVQRLAISVYEVEEFEAAIADPRIGVVQMPLNLFDRRFTGLRLAAALDAGCLVYGRSLLLQGLLAAPGTVREQVSPALKTPLEDFALLALRCDREPIALALGWAARQHGVAGMVIGTDSTADLDELVRFARTSELSEEEVDRLDGLALPVWPATDPRTWR